MRITHYPTHNLTDAMMKAQLFEERNDSLRRFVRFERSRGGSMGNSNTRSLSLAPSPLPTSTMSRPLAPPTTPKLPIKNLTPTDIQDKRDKGLCFSCDEKFSPTRRCKNRMMILLDEDYGELPNDSTSETIPTTVDELLMNHKSAFKPLLMLPIFGYSAATYREHFVEVLIDIGSHNNFIQEGLVENLGL